MHLECLKHQLLGGGGVGGMKHLLQFEHAKYTLTIAHMLLLSAQSTPLHLAAGYNRVGVVEVLIKHGADVHAKDKGGLVPLHNACSYGHYEVAELLVKVGLDILICLF